MSGRAEHEQLMRAPHRPLVGVCGPDNGGFWAWHAAKFALWRAGARAQRLRPLEVDYSSAESVSAALKHLDGLVIGGGADISPLRYGDEQPVETPHLSWRVRAVHFIKRRLGMSIPDSRADALRRDEFESAAIAYALREDVPVVGICRGAQLLAVEVGHARLLRDITSFYKRAGWANPYSPLPCKHANIDESSRLYKTMGNHKRWHINALHLQAIDEESIGPDSPLRIVARDDAGVVQAVELKESDPRHQTVISATQWHPEYLAFFQRPYVFQALVHRIHQRKHD